MRRVEGVDDAGYASSMNVGMGELKSRLGHYLRLACAGEHIVICMRGVPVAELRATPRRTRRISSKDPDKAALEKLAAEGLVTLGRRPRRRRPFRPIRIRGKKLVSQMVIEDRD